MVQGCLGSTELNTTYWVANSECQEWVVKRKYRLNINTPGTLREHQVIAGLTFFIIFLFAFLCALPGRNAAQRWGRTERTLTFPQLWAALAAPVRSPGYQFECNECFSLLLGWHRCWLTNGTDRGRAVCGGGGWGGRMIIILAKETYTMITDVDVVAYSARHEKGMTDGVQSHVCECVCVCVEV